MYQTKDKEIDGLKVIVTQWPARKAIKVKIKLSKLLGPAIAELVNGLQGTGTSVGDMDMDLSKISVAIEKLVTSLDEKDFLKLTSMLFDSTRVNDMEMGIDDQFDMAFAGNMLAMYKSIGFILEVNFGSFFGEGGIGKALNRAKAMMQSQSTQPQNSQTK